MSNVNNKVITSILALVDQIIDEAKQLKAEPSQPTERQVKIEAYMLALADDIKYQEECIAKGYDVDDRIRKRVADYREIYPKEGQASA
ncbi:MAG: hypothetical protein GXY34_00275 [Syntrophomonadaceae bacterium]|nr:hypothetical protein [Syntrophomonadaceae bacterium]